MSNKPAVILCLVIAFFSCPNNSEASIARQTQSPGENAKNNADDKDANRAAVNKDEKAAPGSPAASAPSVEERLRALEEIIIRQQREIQALREILEGRGPENAADHTVQYPDREGGVQPQTASVAARPHTAALSAQPDITSGNDSAQTDQTQKRVEELYKKFGSLRVSGDIRFRAELFRNQGFDNLVEGQDRNRLRFRARLALDGAINKNFDWGLKLASGSFTDPVSSNQSLTDFYDRKPFALERAFIRYDSKTDRVGVQLVAGKFGPTFRRTQLVWDDDLNFEGASEAIYFKTDSSLEQIKLVAFQLPFKEVSGGKDGMLYGGQLQTDWKMSSTVSANVNVAYYDWVRASQVLQALGAPETQVNGGISLSTTNRVIRDANGNVTGLLANFNLFDVLADLTWQVSSRFPVTFTFDYVRNLSSRIDDEQNGYWAGFQVRRTRERGDWTAGYTFARIEQDAILAPFNFSDILSSNSRVHMPTVAYQVADGVTLQWNGLFSQRANKIVLLSPFNRYLNRMQFDVIYKF